MPKISLLPDGTRVCPFCAHTYSVHEIEMDVVYERNVPDLTFKAICVGGCLLETYVDTEYKSEINESDLVWRKVGDQRTNRHKMWR